MTSDLAKNNLFALVDCNNFFVSCERVFQPKLIGKPVVVLSNNDGCAIARSDEAKALQIAMGEPFFKFKHLVKKHNIYVLSSNYTLYGDLSARVMDVIIKTMPEVLVYSIDEAFIDLTTCQKNFCVVNLCQKLAEKITKATGIPVSIGIGATKTIAKIANQLAKQTKSSDSVCYLPGEQLDPVLARFAVRKIWGVGKSTELKLNQLGIYTGLELKNIADHLLQRHFTIVLARTVAELRGVSLIQLDDLNVAKKQIIVSRSFGQPLTTLVSINTALANHVVSAAEKLRAQHSLAEGMIIFLQTSRFQSTAANYQSSCFVKLITPSNNTSSLLLQAKQGLSSIFKTGFAYKKVGVILTGIFDLQKQQLDLFNQNNLANADLLMTTIDIINSRLGKAVIKFAAQGFDETWKMKRQHQTPAYTTNWQQLPKAYAR
jgi:DNA polymerase V